MAENGFDAGGEMSKILFKNTFLHILSAAVTLSLIPRLLSATEISGHVHDIWHNPVTGVTVVFSPESLSGNSVSAVTDSEGYYNIHSGETAVESGLDYFPACIKLYQNFPNPFNPSTTITYSLEAPCFTELIVYDILGRRVRTLVAENVNEGLHSVNWSGTDENGLSCGAGVYLYRLVSGGFMETKKMLLIDSGDNSKNAIQLAKITKSTGSGEETMFTVTITGDSIDRFEKSGFRLPGNNENADFLVTRKGSGYLLSIVHTNDIHATILPVDSQGEDVPYDKTGSFGGMARIAYQSKKLLAQRENVLFLDAGDMFSRAEMDDSVLSLLTDCINLLAYDCITLGNWEFFYGPVMLCKYLDGLKCTVVASNIEMPEGLCSIDTVKQYHILKRHGRKIGIVGCVTTDIDYGDYGSGDISFLAVRETIQELVDELHKQGSDIIILLSHSGYTADLTLAVVIDGIDVIVGGHSHTLLSNTYEAAFGPYPTVVTSSFGEPVLIVHAGCFSRYMGCIDILFDENGIASDWAGDSLILDDPVNHDPLMRTLIELN